MNNIYNEIKYVVDNSRYVKINYQKLSEFISNFGMPNYKHWFADFDLKLDEKEKILLESDLFIHTSRLEGHPTSVIEAISYGVPVLVTPGTNISEDVEKNKLGFVAPLDANKIYEKIIEAYEKRKEFIEITQNEIEYSNSNFEWSAIVKKMIKEYEKYIIK